jgi:hypothetical protein
MQREAHIKRVSAKVVDGKEAYIHETDSDFNVESEKIERQIIELIKELSVRHNQTTFTYTVE